MTNRSDTIHACILHHNCLKVFTFRETKCGKIGEVNAKFGLPTQKGATQLANEMFSVKCFTVDYEEFGVDKLWSKNAIIVLKFK